MVTITRWTGREARILREVALRMTTYEFANRTNLSMSTIRVMESKGEKAQLRTSTQKILDETLAAAGQDAQQRFNTALADTSEAATASDAARNEMPVVLAMPTEEHVRYASEDETAEVEQRRSWLGSLDIDEAKLSYLEAAVVDAVHYNERMSPNRLAPLVRSLRRHVHMIIMRPQHPPIRHRLYVVAAYLSGMQAVLALDMNRVGPARDYACEAFELATATNAADVAAWARATQSLVEYYAGCFHDSLAFARDGLRLSPGGVHTARLALNGEARALARIGDRNGVDKAVEQGFSVVATHAPRAGVSASLTTGGYCHARADGNAATAYLALGDAPRAEEFALHALPVFDEVGLSGPSALTRLDVATALVLRDREPERAADLVREALDLTTDRRFHSVDIRAREFVRVADRWRAVAQVRSVADLVADRAEALPEREAGVEPGA